MRQRKNKTTKFVSKDILIIVIFTYTILLITSGFAYLEKVFK